MQRRTFLQSALMGAGVVALSGCETPQSPEAKALTRNEIEAAIPSALDRLYREVPGSREAVSRAIGVLIFPSVLKAGVGLGGEYGRGALKAGGRTADYYALAGGSLGITLGAERRSVVVLFMTEQALQQFRAGNGWTFGADASYAIPDQGMTTQITRGDTPMLVFVYGNSGLMFNASLEGSRVTRLDLA